MLNTQKIASASSRLVRVMSHFASADSTGATAGATPWKEIRIPVPWGHIAGKEWGAADGKPVLGLHGWLDNCATFDRLAPLLPLHKLRFIAVDLPGHGQSSHLPRGSWYRWHDYIVTVSRIVEHLKWEKFSFLSHSMGAKVSFFFAGCFPQRVMKLVSLDVPVPVPGLSRQLLQPLKDPDPNKWNVAAVYTDWMNFILEHEKSKFQNENLKYAKAMDVMVEKCVNSMKGYVTHDSASILLKRGTKLVSTDPERYVLSRDRRLDIYDFLIPDNYVDQFMYNISCDLLVLMATNSIYKEYVVIDSKRFEHLKRLNVYRVEHVDGTHHLHLNTPEKLAKTVTDFLLNETAARETVAQ